MLFLLACYSEGDVIHGVAETGDPDGTGFHSQKGDDSETVTDTATDTAVDSDSGTTTDSTGQSSEVCYLGPNRDHSVCFPTVPYDSSFGSDYEYPAPYQGSPQYLAPLNFLDLDAIDTSTDIAPNFVASEFMESWKGQWAVLQTGFVDHMQELRDKVGGPVTVTSGYRNPVYNASVGGATYSRHTYGDAADVDVSGWTVEEVGTACEQLKAAYVGLYEDGHTHCDWRDDALDPAFYEASGQKAIRAQPEGQLRWTPEGWQAPAIGFDEGEPFRRWNAYDAAGNLIYTGTGRDFHPPENTATLEVRVGGQITLRRSF